MLLVQQLLYYYSINWPYRLSLHSGCIQSLTFFLTLLDLARVGTLCCASSFSFRLCFICCCVVRCVGGMHDFLIKSSRYNEESCSRMWTSVVLRRRTERRGLIEEGPDVERLRCRPAYISLKLKAGGGRYNGAISCFSCSG